MSSMTIDVEAAPSHKRHTRLAQWVEDVAQMCKPDRVHWCDGSHDEYQAMQRLMILSGTASKDCCWSKIRISARFMKLA